MSTEADVTWARTEADVTRARTASGRDEADR